VLGFLSRFFRPRQCLDPKDPEALRSAFREHYRHFRVLLTANNNALELMSVADERLHADKPFGMGVVRGTLTALAANVYKMVHALVALSDGRYKDLHERFRIITGQIEVILSHQPEVKGTAMILAMDEIGRHDADQVGAKMANLGEIRNRIGLNVPDGFAITAVAAKHFMEASHTQDEINRRLKMLDIDDLESLYLVSGDIQDLIRHAPLPDDLASAIATHSQRLTREGSLRVSVRSSALGEDGALGSFAGQYRTHLGVGTTAIPSAYKDIIASKYQGQAIVYRQQMGYRHQDVLMGAGCMVMVDAAVGGVAYSRPPDDPQSPWVVIHAAPGLWHQIVDGSAPYDLLHVSRDSEQDIVTLGLAQPDRSCLATGQIRELARQAMQIEAHFGSPQDIEWAIDTEGRLFILQARPIVQAVTQPNPERDQARMSITRPPLLEGGITASRGIAAGRVHKVGCLLDILNFPEPAGENAVPDTILVVETPFPDWAVLMDRVCAVVSESGQAATHLATVAREFGVPALFDLSDAFTRLENGQTITVDATARRVYEGRVEELLQFTEEKRPSLMEGSPVHTLLKEALTLITPLHLTAPDSPFFKPSSCRTLHDITRFCHEKALTEMFNFGHRHGARDRSAKQLSVIGMPAQWWVINLDDGYREDADLSSPFIRIEDIVSAPMLCIWRGMTAVPWQGPPPVSMRGLGSIIAQSAMNPQLDPAVRSSMAGRNYFLLSKNYCNLSVRLGYHFALAEASFSELLTESYVNFQFKGGAADERRRQRRVNILGDLLRGIGFRVDIKGDSLTARIEKRPVSYLEERLVILGYLLIHTRQVDMVMDEDAVVARYLDKLQADIQKLRTPSMEKEMTHGTPP